MIEVELPDGRIIEFPAGTAPEVMRRVARQAAGATPQSAPEPQAAPTPRAAPVGFLGRMAQGAGDVFRGIEQAAIENMQPAGQNPIGRAMLANPNLRAVMESATPPPSPEEMRADIQRREADYQASRAAAGDTGFDWGRMAGSVVPSTAAALLLRNPATFSGAAGQGALIGAGMGAVAPATGELDEPERQRNALLGGALGAVGGAVGRVVGRAIAPRVDPNVRTLAQEGVELTPGQAIGGTARRMEERLVSVPLLGDSIRNAQERGIESFNRTVANRALQPLGARVPDDVPVGRDLINHVQQTISAAYDDAIARARPFAPDRQFADDLREMSREFLTPSNRRAFAEAVRDRVIPRMSAGPIDGATYQTIRSDLGRLARDYSGSADPAQRELGRAFGSLRDAMQGLLARTNPDIAPQLRSADRAYSMYLRMADAASRQGATEGVFTPTQLSAAVRAGDATLRRNAYARGDALLQDISDAARATMTPPVANSGTADRLMTAGLGGAIGSGVIPLPALLAGGAGAAAYSRPVSNAILAALLARRPAPIAAAGELISRPAVSVPLGNMLLSPPEPRP